MLWMLRVWRDRRSSIRPVEDSDIDQLAALLVIGLSASHTLAGAMEAAAREVGGPVRGEVEDLLRRSRASGLARALAETDGPLALLAGQLARAHITGAPMIGAVTAFLDTRRAAVRAGLIESARTLPVRLIVPVALFLLPGFIVLLMGPFIAAQVADLTAPVMP